MREGTIKPKHVLVTGAQGFIGKALCAYLSVKQGMTVSGTVRQALEGAKESPITLYTRSLAADTEWKEILIGVDVVVHTAARVHQMQEDQETAARLYGHENDLATRQLAQQAAEAGCKRFIFISTIKVNGESTPPGQPFNEDAMPAPSDSYGQSKWQAEQALRDIAAATGMEVVILRFPLVYGPGVKGNFIRMARWIQKGYPLPLGAVTHNRRSLLALENAVDAIYCCITHPAAANELFLVSDGEDISTVSLLRRTADALGKSIILIPVPVGVLRISARVFSRKAWLERLTGSLQIDTTKIRQTLGWSPKISLSDGLKKTVQCLC